jgi:hypothetical protein
MQLCFIYYYTDIKLVTQMVKALPTGHAVVTANFIGKYKQ